MKKLTNKLLSKTRGLINASDYCARHKKSETDFTRSRRMGFTDIMGLCLNFLRKSLQVEIDRYMELTDPDLERAVTKQAFSKARHKISPDAFRELFEMTGQTILEEDAFGRYKGYRVFAIDGMELQLPKSKQISQIFYPRQNSFCPHARASVLCDVITGFSIHSAINTIGCAERVLAMEHLRYFEQYKGESDLIIFDRGYPSRAMLEYLDGAGYTYLMRLQRSFNAEIDTCTKRDFQMKLFGLRVRVVKLALPSGEEEMLITNLHKSAFTTSEFKALYHLRWGIETKYNTLKNKLDIENFSGKTHTTVLQDFYATLFLSNIAASLKSEANEIIRKDNAAKSLKYEYIPNENVLIGKLKDKLVLILLNPDPCKRELLLDKLVAQIAARRVAIVPDRAFPRPSASHKRACNKLKSAL